MKVIIVDDSSASRLLLGGLIRSILPMVEVTLCSDGFSALAELRSGKPFDLMILDLGLPDISGFQVLEQQKNLRENLEVITISDESSQNHLKRSLELGASDYLTKPLSRHQLLKALQGQIRIPVRDVRHVILVVDDEELHRSICIKTLKKHHDYLFLEASNGCEALRLMEKYSISLMLLDLRMPYMNGYETSVRAKRIRPNLPIIVLSTGSVQEIIENSQPGSFDHILTKPIKGTILKESVENLLAESGKNFYKHFEPQSPAPSTQGDRVEHNINPDCIKFIPRSFLREVLDQYTQIGRGLKSIEECSVLYLEIRKMDAITQEMSSEQCFSFLNSFFDLIHPLVISYGGAVHRFLENGAALTFALHNSRFTNNVVHAALSIQDHITIYNRGRARAGYKRVEVGIGISTGPVAFGIRGSSRKYELGAFGKAFRVAEKTQEISEPLGVDIAMTGDTYDKIDHPELFSIRPIGHYAIEARKEKTPLYEVFIHNPSEIREMKKLSLKYLNPHEKEISEATLETMRKIFPEDVLWEKMYRE